MRKKTIRGHANLHLKRAVEGDLRCAACGWTPPAGLALLHDDPSTLIHAHHVVPLACGGADTVHNLVLLCPNHHALAHRLGRMVTMRRKSPKVWQGAMSPDELLKEIRMIESEPEQWAAYVASGRGRDLPAKLIRKNGRVSPVEHTRIRPSRIFIY